MYGLFSACGYCHVDSSGGGFRSFVGWLHTSAHGAFSDAWIFHVSGCCGAFGFGWCCDGAFVCGGCSSAFSLGWAGFLDWIDVCACCVGQCCFGFGSLDYCLLAFS